MKAIIVVIFVVATLSIAGSLYTLFSIYFFGSKTDSTKLMVYLHIAQIIDAIAGLPNISVPDGASGHYNSCRAATALRVYGASLQVVISYFMVLLVRRILFHKDTDTLNPQRFKLPTYGWVTIFLFPLYTFGTLYEKSAVYDYNSSFCTFGGRTNNIIFLLAPSTVFILLLTYQGILLVRDVRRETDDLSVFYRLLRGLGGYYFSTYIFVLPRIIMRFVGLWEPSAKKDNILAMQYAYEFILYVNGFIYTYIFLLEKDSFKQFEHDNALIYADYDQRLSELIGKLNRNSMLEISNIIHSSRMSDIDDTTKDNTKKNTEIVI